MPDEASEPSVPLLCSTNSHQCGTLGYFLPTTITQPFISRAAVRAFDVSPMSRNHVRPGTPAYMAPEQAANRSDLIDRRTDVYGLGAVLFEILTGAAPHGREGFSLDAVLGKIVEGETPSTRSIDISVPPSLDQICAQAMAKASTDRYGSVEALAAAVQLWLDEEPLAVYRTMVESFEKLVVESPGERRYVEGLAKSLVNLGLISSGMNISKDAEQNYRRAITVYEKLLLDSPGVVRVSSGRCGLPRSFMGQSSGPRALRRFRSRPSYGVARL